MSKLHSKFNSLLSILYVLTKHLGPTVLAISVVNILERKVFYFILQLTVHHARQEPRGRIWSRGPGGKLLSGFSLFDYLSLHSYSATPGMAPPTMGWVFPYPPLMKKITHRLVCRSSNGHLRYFLPCGSLFLDDNSCVRLVTDHKPPHPLGSSRFQ